MKLSMPLIASSFLLTLITAQPARSLAQVEAYLIGKWVNQKDTAESLALHVTGEFTITTRTAEGNSFKSSSGMWKYVRLKKRLLLIYGGRLPKQEYAVRKREGGAYTINNFRRELVFIKKA